MSEPSETPHCHALANADRKWPCHTQQGDPGKNYTQTPQIPKTTQNSGLMIGHYGYHSSKVGGIASFMMGINTLSSYGVPTLVQLSGFKLQILRRCLSQFGPIDLQCCYSIWDVRTLPQRVGRKVALAVSTGSNVHGFNVVSCNFGCKKLIAYRVTGLGCRVTENMWLRVEV